MIKKYFVKKNNITLFLTWEVIFSMLFGSALSSYIGLILGFGIPVFFAVLIFFPLKTILLKVDSKQLDVKSLFFSFAGAVGFSCLFWYLLSSQLSLLTDLKTYFIIIALLLMLFPVLFLFCSFLNNYIYNPNSEKKNDFGQKKIFFIIPSVIFFLIVFFLQPLDIYLHNIDEIPISLWDSLLSMLYFLPFLLAVGYLFYCFPVFIAKLLGTLIAAINISSYLQLMFFNKYVGQIIGGDYSWREHSVYTFLTLGVWVAIIIISIFLLFGFNKKTELIFVFLNIVISSLLFVSLISLFVTAPKGAFEKRGEKPFYYLSNEEQFTVGTGENVIFLIADSVDNSFVKEIMSDEISFFNEFKDFTLYTDTCSVYDFTNYSVPQILYGYTNISESKTMKPFMERYAEQGYRFLFFSNASLNVPGYPEQYIDNYEYIEDASQIMVLRKEYVRNNYIRIVLYQLLPCILKKKSNLGGINFDRCLDYPKEGHFRHIEGNQEFEHELILTENSYSSKCFIYQHIDGAHFPCEDCLNESKYCLNIFKEYIRQMQELGVYDNSVIIIAADHGIHDGVEGFPFPTPATPLFMIKGKNENHNSIILSGKPMYYQDIQATVLKYSGLYQTEDLDLFGKTIDDYGEDELRTRVWFDSDLGKDIHKYTYRGTTEELERVVVDGIYENVADFAFDYSELDE